jgi:hypothetical protein
MSNEAKNVEIILGPDLVAEVKFSGTRATQIEPLYIQLLSEELDFMRKQMERLKKESSTEPETSE